MTEESISNKLLELFELHKSGAITKEEFDKLKKQILSEDLVENAELEKKQEQETIKISDKPIRKKKGSRIWIIGISSIVLIIAAFLVFKPKIGSVAKDQDGNSFKTVKTGNQIWMAENLNVSTFRNGDPIPEAKTDREWQRAGERGEPAWCYYDNDPNNGEIYGKLYNWYAVNDARGIAPTGWHVPTDEEWTTLITYLGGEDVAGGKLKETGITHWKSLNTDATNETGFTALPSGFRDNRGSYSHIGYHGFWWSSTEDSSENAYGRYMFYVNSTAFRDSYSKHYGFSVRCLRD